MNASVIRGMVKAARAENSSLAEGMPSKAATPGQKALKKKHGTPLSFAKAVIENIGEISPAEAETAINAYRNEWLAA